MRRILLSFIFVSFLGMIACNSSSSEGARSDSGVVRLSVTPEFITTDTLAFVEFDFFDVEYDDIETQGLTLKFLLPDELDYVAGSATLVTSTTGAVNVSPSFVGEVELDETGSVTGKLLVFILSGTQLEDVNEGSLQFDVNVNSFAPTAVIGVDLDRGSDPFDATKPEFDVEVDLELQITP